jgi:hypothetical protein
LRLCAWPNVRPKLVAPCYVHISANDVFEVGRHSRVRKKILCEIRREVDEQIHIAVGTAFFSYNGAEDGDMNDASLAKFGFVSAEAAENVREERHKDESYGLWRSSTNGHTRTTGKRSEAD